MSRRSRNRKNILANTHLPQKQEMAEVPALLPFFQKLIIFLFHLLVIILPFCFTWINDELFEFNKMIVIYGFTSLIVAAWISLMMTQGKVILKKTILDLPLMLFFISQLLSTIFSIHPYTSFFGYYTRFHGGLLSIICYILLYYAFVSNFEVRHLKKFILSILIAATLACVYAIPEHFGHSPSCLLITGGKNFDVACWVQDVKFRIFGTFGQPNWLAAYLITLIPLGISSLTSKTTKKITQIFYFVFLSLALMALLFTKSRSGVLGLVFGLLYYFIAVAYWMIQKKAKLGKTVFMSSLTIFLFLVLSLVIGTPFSPSLNQLVTKSQKINQVVSADQVVNRLEIGGTESGDIRKIVWKGSFNIWKRHPIFGSGLETFAYSYYQDRPVEHNTVSEWDFLYNKAHNEFLNFLATTGIIGIGAYLFLLISFGFYTLTNLIKQQDEDNYLLTASLAAGFISLSISNFFGFSTVMVSVLMFLFFAILDLIHISSPKNENKIVRTKKIKLETNQLIGISLIWLTAVYLILMVYNTWSADYSYNKGSQLVQADQLVDGAKQLEVAIKKSPSEALYYDALSTTYSQLAVALYSSGQSTISAQVADQAIQISNKTLELNPVHLNFYRNQARMYIQLAEINPKYLYKAMATLDLAQKLAPTDAKIMYNRALIALELGDKNLSKQLLLTTIEMKPNYDGARNKLADFYLQTGEKELAKQQYEYILKFITPDSQTIKEKLEKIK